jgi:hypothetical protein
MENNKEPVRPLITEPPDFCEYAGGACDQTFGNPTISDGFFVYPSDPEIIASIIEESITKLKSTTEMWDAGTASPALYSPVWVGDTLFLRGRAEHDAVYSLNPATKELKKFLDIPDGKGISDVREETTEEAGEETSLFVCGEPIKEENGQLKIIFKRVSDKPITAGKPIMLIDVTADKSGKIIKKQITGWFSIEELKTNLRSRR